MDCMVCPSRVLAMTTTYSRGSHQIFFKGLAVLASPNHQPARPSKDNQGGNELTTLPPIQDLFFIRWHRTVSFTGSFFFFFFF